MQRQQASQTPASRNHRQSPQEKPGEKLQREWERIAGGIRQQQDRHQWPELYRAAETACRMAAPRGFMRAVSGIYQVYLRPPIVPPSPMQEPNAIPAKSTASTTSTSRQPTQHRHTSHTGTASTEGKATQHSTISTGKQPTPQRHSQRRHTQQPASTTPGRADRHDEGGDRRDDHHRPGPEGVGTPGGDCKVCGFGSAKVF